MTDTDPQVRREQIRQLFTQARFTQPVILLLGLFIVAGLFPVGDAGIILTWFGLLAFVTIIRIVVVSGFFYHIENEELYNFYDRLFLLGLVLSGITWGSVSWITYPSFPMPHMILVVLIVVGITAGSATSLPAMRWYYTCFALPALMPLAVRFFLMDHDNIGLMLGVTIIVYYLGLQRAVFTYHKQLKRMVELAYKNIALAENLQNANIDLTVEISRNQNIRKTVKGREHSLHLLNDIFCDTDRTFAQKLDYLLELGCRMFSMDVGILARIEGRRYEIEAVRSFSNAFSINKDQVFDVTTMVCSQVIRSNKPFHFKNREEAPESVHASMRNFRVDSYIGVTVAVEGKTYGTLSFSSGQSRLMDFDAVDENLLRLMAQWISVNIELNRIRDIHQLREARDEVSGQ
ncbi:MAG: GAF domain-containing protein [Gammaproteobacteria bacterium]|nr:GAF domain-containing protein [Gammaproteobacteria bacterium]